MNKRLDIFLKSITNYADAQCKKLEKTAETQTQKEIIAYKKQATENFRTNTNREISKIQSAAANKAADYEAGKRLELMNLRTELWSKIFDEVSQKLQKFSDSKAYEEFLNKSAKNLVEVIGEEIVFYVRECDMKYADTLRSFAKNADVKPSSKIHFGGIFATDKGENLRADDTLDSRFEEEKKNFFENAEFKVI